MKYFSVGTLIIAALIAWFIIARFKPSTEDAMTRRLRRLGYTQEQIDFLKKEAGLP